MGNVSFLSVLIRRVTSSSVSFDRYCFEWISSSRERGKTRGFGTRRRSSSEKNSVGAISALSRAMRARRVSSSRADLRSKVSFTDLPSMRASTASRLIRRATAPSIPRSEKPISPNSSHTGSPSTKSVACTLRSSRPWRYFICGWVVFKGVNEGRNGSIVWPKSAAKL